jgi:hypothetical protein
MVPCLRHDHSGDFWPLPASGSGQGQLQVWHALFFDQGWDQGVLSCDDKSAASLVQHALPSPACFDDPPLQVHPMEPGKTLMNSFMFNVALILLCVLVS